MHYFFTETLKLAAHYNKGRKKISDIPHITPIETKLPLSGTEKIGSE